jgi:protein tyrosine/serine phosphatase
MSDTPESSRNARSRRGRVVAVLAIVLALAGFLVWRQFFQTYHLVVVDPGKLYRDGNRSLREFKNTLRKTSPRTVIAIIDPQEYNEPEFVAARELVQSRGIAYHWIPIKAGAYPRPEQVREFLAIASNPANHPVLYHDDEGIRRAGMMMAAYQETVLGYDDAKTIAAMQTFGHSERTIKDVRRFIEAYDPTKGLTEDLNATTSTSTAPAGE